MSDKQFSTQPAPANPPSSGGDSAFQNAGSAFSVPGPQIPNQETINSLGAPLSKEELEKKQAELNKD